MHKLLGHKHSGTPFGGGSHRKTMDKFGGIKAQKAHHYADGGPVPGPVSGGRADRSSRSSKKHKKGDTHVNVVVAPQQHGAPGGLGGLGALGKPPVPPPPGAGAPPPMPPGAGGPNPLGGMPAGMPNMTGVPNMMGAAGQNPAAAIKGLGAPLGGMPSKRGGRTPYASGGRAKQGRSDKADDGRKPRQLADHLHSGHGPDTGWVHGKDKGAMTKGRDHWEKYAAGKRGGSARNLDKGEVGPKVDLYAKGGPVKGGGGITGGAGAATGVGRLNEHHFYGKRGHGK
jgi:hypothetical protein